MVSIRRSRSQMLTSRRPSAPDGGAGAVTGGLPMRYVSNFSVHDNTTSFDGVARARTERLDQATLIDRSKSCVYQDSYPIAMKNIAWLQVAAPRLFALSSPMSPNWPWFMGRGQIEIASKDEALHRLCAFRCRRRLQRGARAPRRCPPRRGGASHAGGARATPRHRVEPQRAGHSGGGADPSEGVQQATRLPP